MASISKKLGQLKQWTGEKLGNVDKTDKSDDYKMLELETETRKDGVENLFVALNAYIRSLSDEKKSQQLLQIGKSLIQNGDAGSDKPALNQLARAMIQQGKLHGEDTAYGSALLTAGEAQDQIALFQSDTVNKMRYGLLSAMEKILVSMKDYSAMKKKLSNRRLDYDAKLNKLQKSKKEKPALEEEVKHAHYKYEETLVETRSMMNGFAEQEELLLESLVSFAEAQSEYFSYGQKIMKDLCTFLAEDRFRMKIKENAEYAAEPLNMAKLAINGGSTLDNSATMPPMLSSNRSLDSRSGSISRGSKDVIAQQQPSSRQSRSDSIDQEETTANGIVDNEAEGRKKLMPTVMAMLPIPTSSATTTTTATPPAAAPTAPPKVLQQVRAKYPFIGENDQELSIVKGDIISVTKHIDEGWWVGTCGGRTGMFPANYVEPYAPAAPAVPPVSSRPASVGSPTLDQQAHHASAAVSTPIHEEDAASANLQASRSSSQQPKFSYIPNMPANGDLSSLIRKNVRPPSQSSTGSAANGGSASSTSTEEGGSAAAATVVPPCSECNCDDFSPNVFKKGSCNNCFHKH